MYAVDWCAAGPAVSSQLMRPSKALMMCKHAFSLHAALFSFAGLHAQRSARPHAWIHARRNPQLVVLGGAMWKGSVNIVLELQARPPRPSDGRRGPDPSAPAGAGDSGQAARGLVADTGRATHGSARDANTDAGSFVGCAASLTPAVLRTVLGLCLDPPEAASDPRAASDPAAEDPAPSGHQRHICVQLEHAHAHAHALHAAGSGIGGTALGCALASAAHADATAAHADADAATGGAAALSASSTITHLLPSARACKGMVVQRAAYRWEPQAAAQRGALDPWVTCGGSGPHARTPVASASSAAAGVPSAAAGQSVCVSACADGDAGDINADDEAAPFPELELQGAALVQLKGCGGGASTVLELRVAGGTSGTAGGAHGVPQLKAVLRVACAPVAADGARGMHGGAQEEEDGEEEGAEGAGAQALLACTLALQPSVAHAGGAEIAGGDDGAAPAGSRAAQVRVHAHMHMHMHARIFPCACTHASGQCPACCSASAKTATRLSHGGNPHSSGPAVTHSPIPSLHEWQSAALIDSKRRTP